MGSSVAYRSRRLVFRRSERDEAERVAQEFGWPELGSRGGGGKSVETVWRVDDGTTFHCVEDVTSGEVCGLFRGPRLDDVNAGYRSVESKVDAWSSNDLVDQIYADLPVVERVGAIFRLGLGAPAGFTADFFDAFMTSLRDEEAMVRAATVRSAAYLEWPQLLPELRMVASGDTDPRVRGEANKVISVFEHVENAGS
jgi:hypothetical protein